jgi:hypothetical protein
MTKAVQIIKQKIQDLPSLHLPDVSLPLIVETDASNETWATYYYRKVVRKRKKFACIPLPVFQNQNPNILHLIKKSLQLKNGIKKFRLFLKPVHFTVRTDLKHMKGMFLINVFLEQGNNNFKMESMA